MDRLTSFNATLTYRNQIIATTTFEVANDFEKEEPKVRKKATKWADEFVESSDMGIYDNWRNWERWMDAQVTRRKIYTSLKLTITANWEEDETPAYPESTRGDAISTRDYELSINESESGR